MPQHHPPQEIIKDKPACQICGSSNRRLLTRAGVIRPAISTFIQEKAGQWDEQGWICIDDLQRFRRQYVEALLAKEKGELTQLDQEVLQSLAQHEVLSHNPDTEFDTTLSLGERLADKIADFGGSWTFLSLFAAVLLVWMIINSLFLLRNAFDPYPYILLNLVLSCLAAVQAPVIMMSQNRQEDRDRLRAMHDYQVNLKAELEIRHLHQKVDHLLSTQWERLMEIQKIQMELISEIRERK